MTGPASTPRRESTVALCRGHRPAGPMVRPVRRQGPPGWPASMERPHAASRRARSRKRLHPARGLRQARQAGDPLVAGQGQQRRAVVVPQGVLRPRPVPGDACRHRAEVPGDVRLPRPLRQGVGAQLHPRAVPAPGSHRPHPAAGQPGGGAQDAGAQGRRRQARLQGPDPRHPPRRGGDPRQGALFQPARQEERVGRGTSRTSRRNSGAST